ncbi:MAG: polysaccharide deacetylase family protein [Longimicrobiaceae bacterium]
MTGARATPPSAAAGGAPVTRRLDYGAFCISIDLELAWGIWDQPDPVYLERCLRLEHEIVDRLLDLFGRYRVSATWAVVGRLLERGGAAAGPDERLWYAPEIVQRIRDAAPEQEIGSHSFEHIYFGQVPAGAAASDAASARRVHAEHGLEFTSFVYPRNDVAHLDAIRDAGIRVFRGADEGFLVGLRQRSGGPLGRAAHLLEMMLPVTPAVVHPRVHANGLVELPGSMLLIQRRGLRRLVATEVVEAKARLGLRAAAARHGIFHFWFHPSNFYHQTDAQFAVLERVLAYADRMRERGEIQVVPMKHFARIT